jgi:acyl carrier protein
MDVTERVKTVIAEQFDLDASSIAESASFIDDLGADSLALTELMLALEEVFEVELDDDRMAGIETVGDAVDYIRQQSTH